MTLCFAFFFFVFSDFVQQQAQFVWILIYAKQGRSETGNDEGPAFAALQNKVSDLSAHKEQLEASASSRLEGPAFAALQNKVAELPAQKEQLEASASSRLEDPAFAALQNKVAELPAQKE